MPPSPDTPGARLRAARERLGLSQRELAERLGITQQSYAQYESGARVATLDWLHAVATTVGIDPYTLDPKFRSVRPKSTPRA